MSKLNREQEELELFLEDYINQVRTMSKLTDTEIKVVLRRVMDESPDWMASMLDRYRKKSFNKLMKSVIRDVKSDFSGQVRRIA